MKISDKNQIDADDVDIIDASTGKKAIFADDITMRDIETGKIMSFKQFIRNLLSA